MTALLLQRQFSSDCSRARSVDIHVMLGFRDLNSFQIEYLRIDDGSSNQYGITTTWTSIATAFLHTLCYWASELEHETFIEQKACIGHDIHKFCGAQVSDRKMRSVGLYNEHNRNGVVKNSGNSSMLRNKTNLSVRLREKT
jgi:hypothetical protein